ncbi:MAG TPA: hypothetical protein ENH92_06265 [Ectothiorhodospiraceae bacterium]|nr:hypothetical protein [Ectothiorhodospiraceae bacterium]
MVEIKATNQIDQLYGSSHRAETSTENRAEATEHDKLPSKQELKDLQNARILEANAATILAGADDSQRLLYKAAIEKLNEILEPEFGNNAIQSATDSGIDFSPEATAERIVSLSTAFYGRYREQNPEGSEADAIDSFIELIRGGISQGFDEAKDILNNLQVLEGDIAENIETTFNLVQQKLDTFRERLVGGDNSSESANEELV